MTGPWLLTGLLAATWVTSTACASARPASAAGGGAASDAAREAASRLVGVLSELDGYAGSTFAPDEPRLDVYWRGDRTAQLRAALDRSSRDFPGEISVHAASFSVEELVRESSRLARAHASEFPRVVAVGPRPDGSGLDVQLAEGELARAARTGVDPGLALAARLPVRVTGESSPPLAN